MTEQRPTHPVPLPPPDSISEQARAALLQIGPTDVPTAPAADDVAGWEALVACLAEPLVRALAPVTCPPSATLRTEEIGGVATHVVVPDGVDESDAPLLLELHGGGLVLGGGDLAWKMGLGRALGHPVVTWFPDYRMAPAHRYPAALDDCVAVYRAALETRAPERVAVLGPSAGGNLAAALVHRLKDEGLPVPAALVLLTPELDLTESGDTFTTLWGLDRLNRLRHVNDMYADGADLTHPYLSPLFGDVTGFPPTFLASGTRDLFLSNTVRMHWKLLEAGVPVELRVQEAGPHGGFGGAPEDVALDREVAAFLRRYLG